jgi:hypothetical protein
MPYLVAVAMTFDPDDYELRWPPQLFIEEANRLRGHRPKDHPLAPLLFSIGPSHSWPQDILWLLTEAFSSTVPADAFRAAPGPEAWVSQLVREAATWPEPGVRKPYWSIRAGSQTSSFPRMSFDQLTRSFVQLVEEFEANGYLVQVFGQECVDNDGPLPDRSAVLHARLGQEIADWPLGLNRPGWTLDEFCDLVEVFHDLVARPSHRWYHPFNECGWHYSGFVTGPARRLYRWRVNRLLGVSMLSLRLADSGEDVGRLVRVEPTGLDELPERALRAATPQAVDRVAHAIALFRSRNATVEERRSAVIVLAGILEERRDLLRTELLKSDEGALFQIANGFAVRHQRADQRGDYDPAFLDWLFWWYLGTVELTDQLLARQESGRPRQATRRSTAGS